MPLLPQPDTTSPGALQILYTVGEIDHVTSANFLSGVDLGSLSAIRAEAVEFANRLSELLTNISFITSWRIVDPDGVSLYEESFGSVIPGARGVGGTEVAAQSMSGTLTGKGTPDVGLAQGQTRTVVFLGSFEPEEWIDAKLDLSQSNINFSGLRSFLIDSELVGADHYGVKATYRNYWTPQLNSHYQKKHGL